MAWDDREMYEPEVTLSNGEVARWTSEFELACQQLLHSRLTQLSTVAKRACCMTRPHIPIDGKVFTLPGFTWSLADYEANGYRISTHIIETIKRHCRTPADYAGALRTIDEIIEWCEQQEETRKAAVRDMLEAQREDIEELRVQLVKRKLKTGM